MPQHNNQNCIDHSAQNRSHNTIETMSCDMVVDILNDILLEGLPLFGSHYDH